MPLQTDLSTNLDIKLQYLNYNLQKETKEPMKWMEQFHL
jgi:hypothetical protein